MSKSSFTIQLRAGPISIVLSNIVAAMTLLILRNLGAPPHSSILLLSIGNFACASLIFIPKLTGRPVFPQSFKAGVAILLWALCYSLNYGLFVLFPKSISLSDLIIAQSFAPMIAVLITGDWKNVEYRYKKLLESLGGIGILVTLAYVKRSNPSLPNSENYSELIVVISMLCFLGTNIAARWLTKEGSPLWAQSRVGLLNGTLLFIGFLFHEGPANTVNISFYALGGLLIGLGVLTTQGLFLQGLSRTPPFLAALFLSTSIPISIAIETFFRIRPLVPFEIGLSISYCLFVALISYRSFIPRNLMLKFKGS